MEILKKKSGSKYLVLSADHELIEKYKKIWGGVKNKIQAINGGISEGIDMKKTHASKGCVFCHYWYFKDVGYKFEPHVCNKRNDVLMVDYELKNIAILNVKGIDYRCI